MFAFTLGIFVNYCNFFPIRSLIVIKKQIPKLSEKGQILFFSTQYKNQLVLPLKGVWWSYFLLFWILFYKLKFWDRGVKKSNETEENQRIPQLNFDSTAVVNSGHTLQNALKISTAFSVSAGCCLSTAQRRFLIFKMTEKLKTNNM